MADFFEGFMGFVGIFITIFMVSAMIYSGFRDWKQNREYQKYLNEMENEK